MRGGRMNRILIFIIILCWCAGFVTGLLVKSIECGKNIDRQTVIEYQLDKAEGRLK